MLEPAEIRASCTAKLAGIETSSKFSALLACLLEEDWTTPRIEELFISPDRCVLARLSGEASFKVFIGDEADLIRNIHGIAKVAELDGDEVGLLLGKVAAIQTSRGCEASRALLRSARSFNCPATREAQYGGSTERTQRTHSLLA